MNFNKGQSRGEESISEGDAGVGQRPGIDNDKICLLMKGLMEGFNENMLGIALNELDEITLSGGLVP
jgi:hypothetical protein